MSDRSARSEPALTASRALLSAALGGLLCLGTSCSDTSTAPGSTAATDAAATADTGANPETDGQAADTSVATDATDASEGDVAADTTDPGDALDASGEVDPVDAADALADGPAPICDDSGSEAGVILTSHVDATMTLEKFTALCDEKGGTLEIHSHCGGANSCKGMSYDSGTQVFTEHSCKALNTCTGFSCVLPCT